VKHALHVELTPTNACNQKCSYCFESGCHRDGITNEEADRQLSILSNTVKAVNEGDYDGMCLTFWGGEPFLNVEFMLCAIKILESCKDYRISIYTNGTYRKGMDMFLDGVNHATMKRTSLQFSYDGEPHHTVKRGYSPDVMIEYVKKFLDAGADAHFKATLSLDMIDSLPDIWKSYESLFMKLGNVVSYSPTLDTVDRISEEDVQMWISAMKKIARLEFDFARKHGRPLMSWFGPGYRGNCRLTNTVNVQPDGNIYICHACPYMSDCRKTLLGNTSEIETFDDVTIKTYPDTMSEDCVNCGATYCTICHASLLRPDEDPAKEWLNVKSREPLRCKLFREFGKIHLAFILACCRNRAAK